MTISVIEQKKAMQTLDKRTIETISVSYAILQACVNGVFSGKDW